ncbi:MAG: hypothetical protein HY017_16785 [Betaproteobacteria bacterium]|nr:hypothetical protein [Betaproteobacteria bacterium]
MDTAGAWRDCQTAFDQAPQLSVTRLNRGVLFMQSGEAERAVAEFDSVLTMQPTNAIALSNRGVVNASLGRIDAARADLDAACKRGVQIACARSRISTRPPLPSAP